MNDKQASLEVIAPSVEEAIARGVNELGIPREELNVEVLDEGSGGFLGLAARQARVRLTVRSPRKEAEGQRELEEAAEDREDLSEDEEILQITLETIDELMNRMGIEAKVEAHWGKKDEHSKVRPLLVDITGEDLSILIGRGGETLEAFQYITRLIVSKEMKRGIPIVIDVEGYKARRERQLRRLARRMADQAIELGRTMVLEPMPPNERRIIHVELRENPRVETESVGEHDKRKVTIIPV